MNSPDVLSRLVQAGFPITAVLRCVRFFTAPLRALSPTGLLTAIVLLPSEYWYRATSRDRAWAHRRAAGLLRPGLSKAHQSASCSFHPFAGADRRRVSL